MKIASRAPLKTPRLSASERAQLGQKSNSRWIPDEQEWKDVRQFLLDNEIMYLLAGKLTPYAQHIDAGRFTVKTGENQLNGHAFTQNKFTPKGIQWIAGLWAAQQVKERAA